VAGKPHDGSFERTVEVAEKYEGIYAAVGLHPHDAKLFDENTAELIQRLIRHRSRVIALGEIGLDYYYDHSPRDVQREVFIRQLRMAREERVPVIIHSREADDETVEILSAEWKDAPRAGIMHCFGGTPEMARAVLELGFYVSFAGNVTFKKAGNLREAARVVPLERLLVETDCPYLTPVPFRGKRNEPARVVEVARCLADLHSVETEEIGRITTENFVRIFSLV
ncbi:MAG: TatD family hydrolase, partial [Acidobacteria bacterium]|nr:TatD family hydrolase [Acidobacteriota bacterium]